MARQRFQPAEHLAAIHRTSTDAVSWRLVDAIISSTDRSPFLCSRKIRSITQNSRWEMHNRSVIAENYYFYQYIGMLDGIVLSKWMIKLSKALC